MVVDVMHAPDCGQLQVLEPVMPVFPAQLRESVLGPNTVRRSNSRSRASTPARDARGRLRPTTAPIRYCRCHSPVSFRTTAYVSGVLSTLRITRALSSTLACTGHAAAGPMCGLLAYLNSAFASATSSIFHGRNRSRSVCSSVFKFN